MCALDKPPKIDESDDFNMNRIIRRANREKTKFSRKREGIGCGKRE
jgi:hypothetical protein